LTFKAKQKPKAVLTPCILQAPGYSIRSGVDMFLLYHTLTTKVKERLDNHIKGTSAWNSRLSFRPNQDGCIIEVGKPLQRNACARIMWRLFWPLMKTWRSVAKCPKEVIGFLGQQISQIESWVRKKVQLRKQFQCLQSIAGLGKMLSLTIMLETAPINRFKTVGNFTSYCRKVPTTWTSNNKKKGKGNSKKGLAYNHEI